MLKRKFEELLDYIQPTDYLVSSDQYNDDFEVPVLTAGQSFILGYTNDNYGIYVASKEKPIILFDDFTTSIQWVDFPFKVKSSACKILIPKQKANIRYMYYAILNQKFDHSQHKRYWISEFSKLKFNDYGEINDNIVYELDALSNCISLKENQLKSYDNLIKSRLIGQEVSQCN